MRVMRARRRSPFVRDARDFNLRGKQMMNFSSENDATARDGQREAGSMPVGSCAPDRNGLSEGDRALWRLIKLNNALNATASDAEAAPLLDQLEQYVEDLLGQLEEYVDDDDVSSAV